MRGKVAGLFYFLSLYITWSGKPNLNRCGAVPESPNNRLESLNGKRCTNKFSAASQINFGR